MCAKPNDRLCRQFRRRLIESKQINEIVFAGNWDADLEGGTRRHCQRLPLIVPPKRNPNIRKRKPIENSKSVTPLGDCLVEINLWQLQLGAPRTDRKLIKWVSMGIGCSLKKGPQDMEQRVTGRELKGLNHRKCNHSLNPTNWIFHCFSPVFQIQNTSSIRHDVNCLDIPCEHPNLCN